MEDATAVDDPAICGLRRLDAQGEVLIQLLHQAVVDVAGGDELPFAPIEGRVVDGEEHAHRRLIDSDGLERFGRSYVRERLTDLKAFDTDQRTDVARGDAIYLRSAKTFKDIDLLDTHLCDRAIALAEGYFLPFSEGTAVYATYGDTADIGRVVQRGDKHLCWAFDLRRSGDLLEDGIQ